MNHSGKKKKSTQLNWRDEQALCLHRQLSKEPNLNISLDTLILAACPEKTSFVVISLGESMKNSKDTTVWRA